MHFLRNTVRRCVQAPCFHGQLHTELELEHYTCSIMSSWGEELKHTLYIHPSLKSGHYNFGERGIVKNILLVFKCSRLVLCSPHYHISVYGFDVQRNVKIFFFWENNCYFALENDDFCSAL